MNQLAMCSHGLSSERSECKVVPWACPTLSHWRLDTQDDLSWSLPVLQLYDSMEKSGIHKEGEITLFTGSSSNIRP